MNHELSDLMEIEKPRTTPLCGPFDLTSPTNFFSFWKQGAALIGRDAFPLLSADDYTWSDVQLASMPHLMKTLNRLDIPRKALLLTMVCLANPGWATWLQREHGLHFGHLSAAYLGDEIFQVVIGLLANHPETTPSN